MAFAMSAGYARKWRCTLLTAGSASSISTRHGQMAAAEKLAPVLNLWQSGAIRTIKPTSSTASVKSAVLDAGQPLPVYPNKQAISERHRMSSH
jgi:hypothetical protein